MNPATDWAPGTIVLLVALALGVGVVAWSRRGAALPAPERTRRDELLRQKEAIYTLLREHAGRNDQSAEWAAERDRLELDAARVLRALDALGDTAGAPTPAAPSFGARNPRLVGALWGAGAMLFLGALALTLQEFATPRSEGGTMTGNATPGGSGGGGEAGEAGASQLSPAQEAQLAALGAKVQAAPDDVAARNAYGHALLHAGKLMDSYQQAEAVVKLRADDPESRTHQAIVLIAIGDTATAAKALDRVLQGAPDFAEALAYRGALHFQAAEGPEAIAALEHAATADPSLAPSVQPLLEAARAGNFPPKTPSVPAGAQASSGEPGAPPGAGPSAGTGGAAAVTGPSPEDIGGTITVDAAVASQVKPGDMLFISARPPGVTRGPPTWVKRVAIESLPMTFELGPANAMIAGMPVPAELVVTAHLDRDGNPVTKSPDDLDGKSASLAPGTKGVTITLAAATP